MQMSSLALVGREGGEEEGGGGVRGRRGEGRGGGEEGGE